MPLSQFTESTQAAVADPADDIEFELNALQRFLSAAPRLREESRYLIPPPEDLVPLMPRTPSRAQLRRRQRLNLYHATKLVLLLNILLFVSFWFVDRLLTFMR